MSTPSDDSGLFNEGCGCLGVGVLGFLVGIPFLAFGVAGYLGYPNPIFDDGTPTSDLFGGIIVTTIGVVALLVRRVARKQDDHWRHIRQHGLEGTALVLECKPTGGSENFQPKWVLKLTVEIPGHKSFPATQPMALPHDVASRLVGSTLKLRADPNNLTDFVIVDGLGPLGDWRGR
jgi:hypothetical protein